MKVAELTLQVSNQKTDKSICLIRIGRNTPLMIIQTDILKLIMLIKALRINLLSNI
jgi:hypothetical protein